MTNCFGYCHRAFRACKGEILGASVAVGYSKWVGLGSQKLAHNRQKKESAGKEHSQQSSAIATSTHH